MQKRVLSISTAIVFSAGLFVSCSDDTSANSDVIDVPAKGNVAQESSFDFKMIKSCAELKGIVLAKTTEDELEIDESYDDLDRTSDESIELFVNEDGSATANILLTVDCTGINTIDYEIVNDTLVISTGYYIWGNLYDPDLGDSVYTKVGFIEGNCDGCDAEFELNIPSKFVGAKYLDEGLVHKIVYKKR